MASELHPIPHPLALAVLDTAYTNQSGLEGDFDIGGILFLNAASDENPYQRAMAKVQKDQFDSSTNPGDNSLTGWWLRSQTDWSLGAGQDFMEPITVDGVERGYSASAGLDPFTRPGWLTLLPKATTIDTISSASSPRLVAIPGGYILAVGTTVKRVVGATTDTLTAAGAVTSLCVAGPNILIASDGLIEWAPIAGTFTKASAFTCTGVPRMWWAKSRILMAVADKLYEHAGSTIGAPAALSTVLYDLKDSTASVLAATTTPRSILLAVNAYAGSTVMALLLDTAGALPSTTAPVVVAEFPLSETLYDIRSYLGSFIGIATSAGIRIATVATDGGLTYGPLLGSPIASTTEQVFTAFDRFLHYPTADAGDGRSGLIRIDLSELGKDGRAAWSTFLRTPVADVATVGLVTGMRSAWIATHSGTTNTLHAFAEANGLDTGWLDTSIVRYGTLEEKMYDTVTILTSAPLGGTIFMSFIDSEGSTAGIGTMTADMGYEGTFKLSTRKSMSSLALRFAFTPDVGTPTLGPMLAAWSLKAYPSVVSRGESVVLPLYNFDFEKDAHGVTFGYEGRAWERWQALLARLSNGTQVLVRELHSGASYIAIGEDMVFRQTAPSSEASGFGGIISLQMRTT